MNAHTMKTMKLIALAALVVAGCDPFPKIPTGTPQVMRAIATGSVIQEASSVADQNNIVVNDATLDSVFNVWFNYGLNPASVQGKPNVDSTGAEVTGATDATGSPLTTKTFTPPGGAPTALPKVKASATVTTTSAAAGNTLTIATVTLTAGTDWSVAGTDDEDATALAAAINANATLSPLVVATSSGSDVIVEAVTAGPAGNSIALVGSPPELDVSDSTLTGGADSAIAYQPGSSTGGGIIQVTSPDWWNVGAYSIGGTVTDTGGNPGTFKVTFNVTHQPAFVPTDPYTVDFAWANDPAATGFTVQIQEATAADPVPADWVVLEAGVTWAAPLSTGNNSSYRIKALTPGTDYFVRVLPEPGLAETLSPAGLVSTSATPNVKTVANPPTVAEPTGAPGTVTLTWARMRSAAYRVQTSDDKLTWTDVPVADMTNISGPTPVPSTANPIAASSLNPYVLQITNVSIATHYYRIVPEWPAPTAGIHSGTLTAGPGTPTNIGTAVVTK
jgi:hypothetical protein